MKRKLSIDTRRSARGGWQSIDQKLAARQARMLVELRKATLAQLSPDPEFRARADAVFQAVLDEKWYQ
jgi:hypothetical protein